jgi:hypothetical protein
MYARAVRRFGEGFLGGVHDVDITGFILGGGAEELPFYGSDGRIGVESAGSYLDKGKSPSNSEGAEDKVYRHQRHSHQKTDQIA